MITTSINILGNKTNILLMFFMNYTHYPYFTKIVLPPIRTKQKVSGKCMRRWFKSHRRQNNFSKTNIFSSADIFYNVFRKTPTLRG